MVRYKNIKRKKFTQKQLELLEKAHYLHVASLQHRTSFEEQDKLDELNRKIFDKLIG